MSLQRLRMVSAIVIALAALLLPTTSGFSQLVFDNGGPNMLDMPTGTPAVAIEVRDGPGGNQTTLDVEDGAVIGGGSGRSVGLFGQSIYTMIGGSASGDLFVTDSAHAILSGGTFGDDAVAEGNGRISLLPGGSVGDDVTIRGNAHLEMSGGTFPDEVFIEQFATATFSGGVIGDDLNPVGNSVVTINDLTLEDSIDALGSSLTNMHGGVVKGSINASESAKINITGGSFPNVFSDGEGLLAAGPQAMIAVTGGTFGVVGASDGGAVTAGQGGMVSFSGGIVPGISTDSAPLATFSAVLNGRLELSDSEFGDLALAAGNGGTLKMDDVIAKSITVSSLGGGVVNIEGGQADSLSVFSELGGFVKLRGGSFADIDVELVTNAVLTVYGHSFTFLGTPVESLPGDAFLPATGELRTIGGVLAGVLADGSPFGLTYSRQFNPPPGARVFLVQVPEPATSLVALAGLAWLGMFRSRIPTDC